MFDFTDLDLTRLDLRKLDLPKFDLPKLEIPELPAVPTVDVDRVAALIRDAAYVGVGAAVIAAKVADDRTRELVERVSTQVRRAVATAA